LVIFLLACTGEQDEPHALVEMDPLPLLSRLSLDLRGRRPSEEEIEAVEADPDAIDGLVQSFVEEDAFGERLVSLHADVFRTRTDHFVVGIDGDGAVFSDIDKYIFQNNAGEEPLRIIERIANEDLPWTDFVTADWTMTTAVLAEAWPLERLEDGDGWVKARYTDGRPAAGALATNGLWWRYTTTIQNANRGRAEAVARYFLCDNRFDQPVEFQPALDALDSTQLVNRIDTEQACIGCHVMLDPIGSFLFGFYRNHPESYSEAIWYYPARETEWEMLTGKPPGYYGQPGDTLYDLGQLIAADPRYASCAVEHAFTFLYGHEPGVDDTNSLTRAREDFIQGGGTLRALYASLASQEKYRSTDEQVEGTVPLKRLSSDQLAGAIKGLTGFEWSYNGLNLFTNDAYGVRVLAGGADGLIVTQPATDSATTILLVQERMAEAGADYAITNEAALAVEDRTLFTEVDDLDTAPSDSAIEAQIARLILLAHGRRAGEDDADVADLADLWSTTAASSGDPRYAWKVVFGAILRHPDFVFY
jgi:hypothetical protein